MNTSLPSTLSTMSPVHVLDKYYLAITLLVTVGYQMLGFLIAWTFQVCGATGMSELLG